MQTNDILGILFEFRDIRTEVQNKLRREGESSGDDEDEEINAFIFQLIEIIHNIWYFKKAKNGKKELLDDAKNERDNANVLVEMVRKFLRDAVNTETNNEESEATVGAVINQLKTKWKIIYYKQDDNGKLFRDGEFYYTLLSCLLMSEISHQETSANTAEDIFSGVFTVKYL